MRNAKIFPKVGIPSYVTRLGNDGFTYHSIGFQIFLPLEVAQCLAVGAAGEMLSNTRTRRGYGNLWSWGLSTPKLLAQG